MAKKTIYKVIFQNQGNIYEIFARSVHEGEMFGFIVVEEIVFGERSSVVVDPSEEKLKSEFNEVSRTYIPMHSIIRIDEVEKEGASKITELPESGSSNVTSLDLSQGQVMDLALLAELASRHILVEPPVLHRIGDLVGW